jgi:Flp pilus assembly protein CpaB
MRYNYYDTVGIYKSRKGDFMNSIKRFFKNKNTVTVLGIIVIVAMLWGVYTYQINKQVKPISVPVAAKTIDPKTKITAEMITYVEVPSAYISENAITDDQKILSMYSNYNTVIPAGSMFYEESLTTEKALPNYLLKHLKEGEFLLSFDLSSIDSSSAWGIMPGDKIDLYMRVVSDEGSVMLGKFLENVEILDVLDQDGRSTYDVSDGSREANKLVFAVQEDIFLMLMRANYLDVEFMPIPHGAWINDKDSSITMTTQELIDYIKARVVTLSTDPVPGQTRNSIQQVQ